MNTTRLGCKPSLLLRRALFGTLVFFALVLYISGSFQDAERPLFNAPNSANHEKLIIEKHQVADQIIAAEALRQAMPMNEVPTFISPFPPLPLDQSLSSPLTSNEQIHQSNSSNLLKYNLTNLGMDMIEYCRSLKTRVGEFVSCPLFLSSEHTRRLIASSNFSVSALRTIVTPSYNEMVPDHTFKTDLDKALQPLSFVTQCSSNRLHRIAAILERWKGPVSAAVFVENVTVMREVIAWYNAQVSARKSLIMEYLDIHIVIDDPKKIDKKEYPINVLRNIAMNLTLTPWILVADADAMPSNEARFFYDDLRRGIQYNVLAGLDVDLAERKSTFLVPAFETTIYYNLTEVETPSDKGTAVSLFHNQQLLPMHHYFRPAYLPTDYERWSRVDTPYEVPYQLYFEPYYIARISSDDPPRYDDRFTNYGKNKAQQNYELHAKGYTMTVLPNAFIIDMGHPEGSNWRREFDQTKMFTLMNHFRVEVDLKYNRIRWHDRSSDFLSWFQANLRQADSVSDI